MSRFSCGSCGAALSVETAIPGQAVMKCPRCGHVNAVPASSATGTTAPQRAAVPRAGFATAADPSAGTPEAPASPAAPLGEFDTRPEMLDTAAPGIPPGTDPVLTAFLAPPQAPDELGRLGPYRILKILGVGGMGIVFLAEEPQLSRQVAVKAMLPALAANAQARQRFVREARAAAAVEHEHIVHINQVGEDRGVPFVAMPLLQGETLQARLAREGRLPVAEAMRIGREVAEGLAAAHARGLVHRDIKPANLWLEQPRGRVRILDFGLARAVADTQHLTHSGGIVGTPSYMAPEQARGEAVDGRSDLFSLGCVLYHMLAGAGPFPGKDPLSVLHAVTTHQPSPPRERNSAVPRALSDFVMRLLAKDPAGRPASARAVADWLAAAEQSPPPSPSPAASPRRRRPWVVGACLLTAAVPVVAGVLAWAARRQPADEQGSEPPRTEIVATDKKPPEPSPKTELPPAEVKKPPPEPPTTPKKSELPPEEVAKDGKDPSTPPQQGKPATTVPVAPEKGKLPPRPPPADPAVTPGKPPAAAEKSFAIKGHTNRVLAVAFSRDGKRLATGGVDRTIRIWDTASHERLALLRHTDPVWTLAFAPDGKTLYAGDQTGSIAVWDLDTAERLRRFEKNTRGLVVLMALAPDGQTLATVQQQGQREARGDVVLWDVATGKPRVTIPGDRGALTSLAFSPDGATLAGSRSDETIRLWDVASGKERDSLKGHDGPVEGVAFDPSGKRLASAGLRDKTVTVWDLKTGNPKATLEGHASGVRLVAFPSEHTIISAAEYRLIVWWLPTKRAWFSFDYRKRPPPGLSQYIYAALGPEPQFASLMALSPDGRSLAVAFGEDVYVWNIPVPAAPPR